MSTPPTAPPDQETLEEWGARFVNALLDSRGDIGSDFWTRARTMLETAATAVTFGEMTSKAARKIECRGALSAESTAVIADLRGPLSDPAAFGAFAELCRRDAAYVTALARIARDERKEAAKTRKAAKAAPDALPEF